MPTERLSMRRIRDLLRLKFTQGMSDRAIAGSLGLSKGTVGNYLMRFNQAGLSWPLPCELDDDSLELLLFPRPPMSSLSSRPVPDWVVMDRELRRPGVTRALLWEEYRTQSPDGFGYAWFCEHFDAWKGRVRPTMRQTHVGGEKIFVDFAGDTIDLIDPATGEARAMKLFVATMGASNYTYAEAVASEGLEDWILAHVRMFAFLGGVPKAVVPDNLKSAVIKADRFDPGLNRTYAEMAAHYGTAVLPARPRKPRDKAKVEVAVQVAQRWILARLRNHRFFSLVELNVAIRRLLDELNMRVMRGYGASRADLFATLDRPNLQPLPPEPYVFARWKRARVAPDYHVEVDSSWYSVPFALIKQEVDVRTSGQTVEIFHRGQRVASHLRTPGRRSHVTVADHMPSAHRRFAEWTPARMLAQATKTGPAVAAFCEMVMADRPHPEQGFRTCLGVLALVKTYGPERVDAACQRGVTIRARTVTSIRSILKTGLDRAFMEGSEDVAPLQHANIRGGGYYHVERTKMLTHPTHDRLLALGLTGFAKALEEQRRSTAFDDLPFEERLGLLVDREAAERDAKKLASRLKFAALRQDASVEDLDLRTPRGIDRSVMAHLADGGWIARHENLLITGPTGLGKSWIACALGHKACRDGRPVLYQRSPRMFEALALARGDGRHERILKTIARMEVLIIDDWGLAVLSAPERRDLLEILEDRHGRASTIVTSQLPVEHWHEAIGDPTLADAILDRLVHNAHRLKLTGESMRKAAARNSSLDLSAQA